MTDTNLGTIRGAISAMLPNEHNVMIAPKIFAKVFGGLNVAHVLNQTIYWSDKTDDQDGWFAKSYEDWEDELTLTKKQMSLAIKKLQEYPIGFEVMLRRSKFYGGAPVLHFRVDVALVIEFLAKYLDSDQTSQSKSNQRSLSDSDQTSQTYTKITTETTTEIKIHSPIGADASTTPKPDPEPPPTDADALSADDFASYREHIRAIFRVTEGRDLGILHQLRGTAKKGAYKTHQLTPPVTLDEIQRFGEWMRVTYPAIYVSSPEKIRDYIQRFRQAYPVNPEPEEYGGIDFSTPEAQEAIAMLTKHWGGK